MYGDATIRLQVEHEIKAFVEPRLGQFADRLGGMMASAHAELRGVERQLEAVQSEVEMHLAGIDARVHMLTNGTQRSEQREKELNLRVASLAEGILQRRADHIFDGLAPVASLGRAERNSARSAADEELAARLRSVEQCGERLTKTVQHFEHRLSNVEGCERDLNNLSAELRRVLQDAVLPAPCHEHLEERLAALETCCTNLRSRQAVPVREPVWQGSTPEAADGAQQAQQRAAHSERAFDALRSDVRLVMERQAVCSGRVDDAALKASALKVKVVALERRVASLGDRLDIVARPLDDGALSGALSSGLDTRLAALELRIDGVCESWEDVVNQIFDLCSRRQGGLVAPPVSLLGCLGKLDRPSRPQSGSRDSKHGKAAPISAASEHGSQTQRGTPPQPTDFGEFVRDRDARRQHVAQQDLHNHPQP